MTDIFDQKIVCSKCGVQMKPCMVHKNGFELRAVECPKCRERIVHPADLNSMNHFNDLKDRKFNVKLRMVGNSHAVSIPKEIIDFMNEQHRTMKKHMDEMVSMCFEDFGTLRLSFGDEDFEGGEVEIEDEEEEPEVSRARQREQDEIHRLSLRRAKRRENGS